MHHDLKTVHGLRLALSLTTAAILAVSLIPALTSAQPMLLDPATQPKFVNDVPDALAPGFIYQPTDMGDQSILST